MDVDNAISRCPFLHGLALTEGRAYASSIAVNPLLVAPSARRPLLEEEQDFAGTFRLFHGAGGVVPLPQHCSFVSRIEKASENEQQLGNLSRTPPEVPKLPPSRNPLSTAPLAAMSLGMPDFGDFIRKMQRQNDLPKKPTVRKPLSQGRGDVNKPSASATSGKASVHPPGASSAYPPATSRASTGPKTGGTCPLRKFLGPSLSGMVLNSAGGIQCPTPIIQARAALAATQPIKLLRPQALPIKFVAVGACAAAVNIPCGMWRQHTEKFSFQWFAAVHASIPFIAMLRKAVIMPKIAIACTIAMAIVGQTIGAKMEKQRMEDALRDQATAAPGNSAKAKEPEASVVSSLSPVPSGARKTSPSPLVRGRIRARQGSGNIQSLQACSRSGQRALSGPVLGEDDMLGGSDWRMEGVFRDSSFKQLLALPPVPAC